MCLGDGALSKSTRVALWSELIDLVRRVGGEAIKDVAQIAPRVEAKQPGAVDQRIDRGGGFRAPVTARAWSCQSQIR